MAAFENFSLSCSSRTKAFTTRMAEMFSCTEAFRSSYLRKVSLNSFIALRTMRLSTTASTAIAPTKIRLSSRLMTKHITMELMSVIGARTAMRMHIEKAFCRLFTSVVMRVMRPAVENLSMLENENVWMLVYIASRRLAEKPDAAVAA